MTDPTPPDWEEKLRAWLDAGGPAVIAFLQHDDGDQMRAAVGLLLAAYDQRGADKEALATAMTERGKELQTALRELAALREKAEQWEIGWKAADLNIRRAEAAERDNAALREKVAHLETIKAWAENHPDQKRRPFSDQLAKGIIDDQVKEIDRLTELVKAERAKLAKAMEVLQGDWAILLYNFILNEFTHPDPSLGEPVTADIRSHFNALCEFMAKRDAILREMENDR